MTNAAQDSGAVEDVGRLQTLFVVASAPALVVGLASLGLSTANGIVLGDSPGLPGWRGTILESLGFSYTEIGIPGAFLLGLLFFAPLLLSTLLTSFAWAATFARVRQRPIDSGWLMCAWLFTLLLPATVPPAFAVIGISVGVIFGSHIFGGSGKYIISPALLGVVFLSVSYPDLFATEPTLHGAGDWALIRASAADAPDVLTLSWTPFFLGLQGSAFGTPSTIACLVGVLFLIVRRAASYRVVLGAVVGAFIATMLLTAGVADDSIAELPWYLHLSVGGLAFGIAFLATDPTISPRTAAGRWIYGLLIGLLAIAIRITDPSHPEGSLSAILLASLCIPLIDHAVVWFGSTSEGLEQA